jgi:hypothetical protein
VLLVALGHAGVGFLKGGYVGVDVFFVLSGFLITSLLARELLSTGRLRFVAFYARRVRRLLPAALLVLPVTAIVYELVASPLAVSERPLKIGDDIVDPGGPGWLEEVGRGTDSFLTDLRPFVGEILVVQPLPETTELMVDCLSTGADPVSCSAPAIHLRGTIPLRSLWDSLSGVAAVSLDGLLCPNGTCPAMVDGVPTYRDTNHLTVDFSHHLAKQLDEYLRSQGIVLGKGRIRAS